MSGGSFLDAFAESVRQAPDRTALRAFDSNGVPVEIGYGALAARAEELARRLGGLPELKGPEPRVALAFERGPDLVVGMLAALRAGAVFLPLDLEVPAARSARLIEDSGAALVLTRERSRPRLPKTAARTVSIEELAERSARGTERGPADPGSLAYTIYTSGSTGEPKGVLLSHGGLAKLVAAQPLGLRSGDVVLQAASPNFDASVFEIVLSLAAGATLDLGAPGPSPVGSALFDRLRRGGISAAVLTPSVLATLPTGASEGLAGLRVLMLAGEPCSARLAEEWGSGRELLNGYGPTEATVCSTVGRGAGAGGVPPLGRAIAGTRIVVVDERSELLREGEGELLIGGAGLARGYHRRADLTAERFVPDRFSGEPGARLYASGDLVRRSADGELAFVGRADGQVKIHGCRVEPGEIEAALAGLEPVAEAAVVARDGRLAAFVVPRGEAPSAGALREELAERLPSYMVPATVAFLDRLPLLPSGKLDRAELERRSNLAPDGSASTGRAPESALERSLAEIWQEILGRKEVALDDDFFELGGHSLHAMQLILRVRDRLGLATSPRLLFRHSTLAGMARALGGAAPVASDEAAPHDESERGEDSVRPPRGALLPLSLAQRQLWYLDQLKASAGGAEPGDVSYNMLVTVRFRQRPDVSALRSALDAIVKRHEVLRTRFVVMDGEPRQRIEADLRAPFASIDASAIEPRRFEPTVAELTELLLRRPFDLARDAMLRVALVLGREDHRVVLTMHHIASDGWSIGVLLHELSTLYAAFRDDPRSASPLPALQLQYADVARWQDRAMEGPPGDRLLDYWKRQLDGAPQHLEGLADRLPAAGGRGARNPGANYEFALSARQLDALETLGRARGTTLFMTLLAAWSAFLYRRTGQQDLLHSVPFAGRLHPASEALIGFFTNMLVLRIRLGDELGDGGGGVLSFGGLLAATRETCLDAFAHQNLPFVRLVEALRPERQEGRMPFVQVGFALQNAFRTDRAFPELEIVPTAAHTGTSRFELSLSMTEEEGRLAGSFEYRTDLFDPATVARLAEGLRALVDAVVRDPATPLDRLALLAPAERHQLLCELSGEDRPYDLSRPLHALVEDRIALRPDAECARFEGWSLTYCALGRAADRLARRLRDYGVGPGSAVGLFLDRSLELPVAFLATLMAGAACAPLDPDHPPDRLSFLLADTAAKVVVTQEHLLPRLPADWRGSVLDVSGPEELSGKKRPFAPAGPEDLAYIVYTSGSTGHPKGVLMHHRGLVNRLLWQQDDHPIGPGDRVLQNLSIGFDAAIWQIFGPLIAGATIVLPRPGGHRDPAYLARFVAEEQVTCADFVPSILAPLLDAALTLDLPHPQEGQPPASRFPLSRVDGGAGGRGGQGVRAWAPGLRQIVSGGEALDRELARRVLSGLPGARLINIYGPTETSLTISAARCEPADSAAAVPVGRPIANTRAYLLDAQGEPVPIGVAGEVFAAGVGLTFGYLNRPDLTAERFLPNPFAESPGERLYRTGDLARRLADGNLEFLGRADRQVKIRGVRIELGEIETRLREVAGIQDAAVLARTDVPGAAPGEKRLVAYVVADVSNGAPAASALRAALSAHLPAALVPGVFVFLSEMPVTRNGKLDRKALPAPESAAEAARERVPPRDRMEAELAAIWCRALGLDEISVTDHFFDLGGHSLLAVKLMSEIQKCLGVALDLAELYAAGTVEEMARRLRGRPRAATPGAPVVLAATRPDPDAAALFCVHAVDGAVHGYAHLARRLEDGGPVYGLPAPGLEEDDSPLSGVLDDFEALAAHHVESLIAFLPRGELALCGWSTGGLLASAMACRLEDLGRAPQRLILLDTHPSPPRPEREVDEAADLREFFARIVGRDRPAPGLEDLGLERRWQVFRRLVESSARYRPRAHRRPTVLIQAGATPQALRDRQLEACRALTLGSFEVLTVSADHFDLLRPPAVFDVADRVAQQRAGHATV